MKWTRTFVCAALSGKLLTNGPDTNQAAIAP
jgi:hypothetical protein